MKRLRLEVLMELFNLSQVFDKKTGKLMHIINATTPEVGNWMRYVNCARFFEEQNIVSIQEGCEIFYEALKVNFFKITHIDQKLNPTMYY